MVDSTRVLDGALKPFRVRTHRKTVISSGAIGEASDVAGGPRQENNFNGHIRAPEVQHIEIV